ncbi:MAG: hypothetical protein KDD85_06965 [Parvularculaceae bacterium]|nr:hypothetical protein [Parvularculaceae bacterium]
MRSHLTAFGVGAGFSLFVAAIVAIAAPKVSDAVSEKGGVHIVNIGRGGSGSFHLKEDGLNVSADWKGKFAFAADGRTLSSLKGEVEVVSVEKDAKRKAVFEGGGGDIQISAYAGGEKIDAEDEAAELAGDLLQLFARSSGVNADQRVSAIMAESGKAGVIAEIGDLRSAHAVGAYIEAFAQSAKLDAGEISALIDRIAMLEGDYSKRTAISAILKTQTLGEENEVRIIQAAKTIEGDHELRLMIEDLAEHGVNARSLSIASNLVEGIEGDHEIRLALSAFLENDAIDDVDAASLLDLAATSIDGDYELRLAVEAAGDRVGGETVGAAAIRAIGSIEGAHDRRIAIDDMADRLSADSSNWTALIELAAAIDGDYERRLAIEALSSKAPDRPAYRAALKQAAASISSEHERRLALESLD